MGGGLFDSDELGILCGGVDGLDGVANHLGFFEAEFFGEVFFARVERGCDFFEFWDDGFSVNAVGEEDFNELGCPFFAGPFVLGGDVFDAGGDSFADLMGGEDAESFDADFIGKHNAAGGGSDDCFEDGGEQGFDFLFGEIAVDGADAATGASVFVFKAGFHRFVEDIAIHSFERAAEHAPASVKEGEGEVALLHSSWVFFFVDFGEEFEEFRCLGHGGGADGGEGFGGFDAEPEVVGFQTTSEGVDGGRTPASKEGDGLAGSDLSFERRRIEHLEKWLHGDIFAASEGHGSALSHDG